MGPERSLISIYLKLRGGAGLRIQGAAMGWGLSVGIGPPHAYDMADAGRVEIEPAGETLASGVGRVVTVWTVHAPGEPIPVGARWTTTSGADVVVYAYDDTLLVTAPDALELDGVTYTGIC